MTDTSHPRRSLSQRSNRGSASYAATEDEPAASAFRSRRHAAEDHPLVVLIMRLVSAATRIKRPRCCARGKDSQPTASW